MTKSQTTLKLNISIDREKLLAKLPKRFILHQKKDDLNTKASVKTTFITKGTKRPDKNATPKKHEATPQKDHKIIKREDYAKILKHLNTKYPNCFSRPVKPLKIGIREELFIECVYLSISKKLMRRFLEAYCRNAKYRNLVSQNATRVDLEGNAA